MKKTTIILMLLILSIGKITFAQITNPAPYCAASFVANYNMFNNIKIKGASLSFGAMGDWTDTNGYKFYDTLLFPNLKKADTFSVQLNVFSVGDVEPEYFALWIDYNHDNTFDSSELVLQNSNTIKALLPVLGAPVSPINKVLTVPATAITGITRARLMRGTSSVPYTPYDSTVSLWPCPIATPPGYGCTYDFNVNIVNNTTSDVSIVQTISPFIEIYPNPASNDVYLKGEINGTVVNFIDEYGRMVQEIITGNHIDISHLAAGLYFLQIPDSKQVTNTKLIIER